MNGSQQNSTKNKSRRKLWLKPGFLCLVCFFLASAAFFVLGKYYYDRNLQEMKEAEIQSYQSRKFTLAGYEIGEELDSVDGYHRCVSTNCFLRTNFKWEKAQCLHGYHKVAAIDSANLIDGMRGFFKLDVFASEYTEKGVTRNKISHICLTADGIPEKMKFWTIKYYALILEEKFGRRRFGRRIDQIERHGCWDEKIANWVACMNLENDRMLRIRSNEPGRVSVELIDCFVPSRPRNP